VGESAGLSLAARAGGVALALTPMLRPTRYRLRLSHPNAAAAQDRLADHALPLLVLVAAVLAVIGLLPSMNPALRLFWLGSAFGLFMGLPFVQERRRLRARLRELPPVRDPVEELGAALLEDPAAAQLVEGDVRGALAAVAERDRDDLAGLRVGAMASALLGDTAMARARALRAVQVDARLWEAPAQTGLQLCRGGRFGEGLRLLFRAVELSDGHHRAELMLAHGMALAGRLRDAVEALDRIQGRPPRHL